MPAIVSVITSLGLLITIVPVCTIVRNSTVYCFVYLLQNHLSQSLAEHLTALLNCPRRRGLASCICWFYSSLVICLTVDFDNVIFQLLLAGDIAKNMQLLLSSCSLPSPSSMSHSKFWCPKMCPLHQCLRCWILSIMLLPFCTL